MPLYTGYVNFLSSTLPTALSRLLRVPSHTLQYDTSQRFGHGRTDTKIRRPAHLFHNLRIPGRLHKSGIHRPLPTPTVQHCQFLFAECHKFHGIEGSQTALSLAASLQRPHKMSPAAHRSLAHTPRSHDLFAYFLISFKRNHLKYAGLPLTSN